MNVTDAIRIASEAHRNQFDKVGAAYILHPLRVMQAQSGEYEQMAAVLHDTVEDTAVTFEYLKQNGIPEPVIEALRLLTHDDDTPYEDYIDRLASNPIARAVKLADLVDNMDIRRLNEFTERDAARLAKYHRAWRKLTAIN